MAIPQQPFHYEDKMESVIQFIIQRNNKFNPDGRLNDIVIPPKRIQQQLRRAKWYKPEQHAQSPYLLASINAPPVLNLDSPYYPVILTISHLEIPAGNPDSRPITFNSRAGSLSYIDTEGEILPWLLLRHDPSAVEGGLKEIDGENELDCHAGIPEELLDTAVPEAPKVNAENGFMTVAVGESKVFEVQWKEAGRLVKKGERYSFCYRGTLLRWWKWGTLEEIRGERKVEQEREAAERVWIACTNVVEFTVEG